MQYCKNTYIISLPHALNFPRFSRHRHFNRSETRNHKFKRMPRDNYQTILFKFAVVFQLLWISRRRLLYDVQVWWMFRLEGKICGKRRQSPKIATKASSILSPVAPVQRMVLLVPISRDTFVVRGQWWFGGSVAWSCPLSRPPHEICHARSGGVAHEETPDIYVCEFVLTKYVMFGIMMTPMGRSGNTAVSGDNDETIIEQVLELFWRIGKVGDDFFV